MLKQTSVFVLMLLLLSMLVPILAAAAIVFNGTYANNGVVSGQIRFDGSVGQTVYGQPNVTVGVYASNGQHIQDVTVSFASYANGVSSYTIPDSTVINSVYDAVYFKYGSSDATGLLYRESPDPDDGNGGGGAGGGDGGSGSGGNNSGGSGNTDNGGSTGGGTGGGGTSGPGQSGDVSDVIEATDGTVDADKLKAALSKYTEVTIKVTGDTVAIPASALIDANTKSILNIVTDHGTYILPLSAIDLPELADKVQANVSDMKIHVAIYALSGDKAAAVTEAIAAVGGKALSAVFEMSFSVEGTNGAKMKIANFDQYVKRKIPLKERPVRTATIALYNPDTKQLSFVPGSISNTEAAFWRTGNSIYTVVELNKTFNDIASHWAESNIELLTSKLIVEGMTDTTFEPDRNLTRAEFVALATRSFGLVDVNDGTYFSDVGRGSWYSGMIAAAAKAGIINGYEDDTFRPNAPITREELAAIIVRAYRYAGGSVNVDAAEQTKLLSGWSDANEIVWGQAEVAKAISAGFIQGMTDSTLETYGSATRAQTVTMLKRVLSALHFID
jgi:hypothetical protein